MKLYINIKKLGCVAESEQKYDDVYLDKLQTRGVKKSILYM
jgi:hypothetical protein